MNSTTSRRPEIDRAKLDTAFKAMRAAGLLALQNAGCCQGCIGCRVADRVEAMPEGKRAAVKGTAFYSAQDASDRDASRTMYISHGPISTNKHGDIGAAPEAVGAIVVAALRGAGLTVEWDGNPTRRIAVLPA